MRAAHTCGASLVSLFPLVSLFYLGHSYPPISFHTFFGAIGILVILGVDLPRAEIHSGVNRIIIILGGLRTSLLARSRNGDLGGGSRIGLKDFWVLGFYVLT